MCPQRDDRRSQESCTVPVSVSQVNIKRRVCQEISTRMFSSVAVESRDLCRTSCWLQEESERVIVASAVPFYVRGPLFTRVICKYTPRVRLFLRETLNESSCQCVLHVGVGCRSSRSTVANLSRTTFASHLSLCCTRFLRKADDHKLVELLLGERPAASEPTVQDEKTSSGLVHKAHLRHSRSRNGRC